MAEHQTLKPGLLCKTVHRFPLPTWIENIAVRSNGDLLLTLLTKPEVYLVKPSDPSNAVLVHYFDDATALAGIIEVAEDMFYVGGGKFNAKTNQSVSGSFKVWEIDMRDFVAGTAAPARVLVDLKDVGLPNGFELLSKEAGTILVADSSLGCVWKVNVNEESVEKLIEVDEMKPPPPPVMQMGVNGLAVRDGYLYWSNTTKSLFCRIKIDDNGAPSGALVEVLESGVVIDDFCFDGFGNAWVAQHMMNTVGVIRAKGGVVTVAGSADQLTVAGGAACQFGRMQEDESVLYVVTTGGLSAPVDGSQVEGGKFVAIETRGRAVF